MVSKDSNFVNLEVVRVGQQDNDLEAMSFAPTNEPRPFTACIPNVKHYEVRSIKH